MNYKGIECIKDFELLTDSVRGVFGSGKFPTDDTAKWDKFLEDSCGGDRVFGLIAFPTIDIELEAYTRGGGEPNEATDTDNEINLSYFVCIKGLLRGKEEWLSDDCAGVCTIDFKADNWEELLTNEMCECLEEYAVNNGYSFTELNFDEF